MARSSKADRPPFLPLAAGQDSVVALIDWMSHLVTVRESSIKEAIQAFPGRFPWAVQARLKTAAAAEHATTNDIVATEVEHELKSSPRPWNADSPSYAPCIHREAERVLHVALAYAQSGGRARRTVFGDCEAPDIELRRLLGDVGDGSGLLSAGAAADHREHVPPSKGTYAKK